MGKELDLLHELLQRRYLLKDGNGRPVEDACGMFERVAGAIAGVETGHGKDPAEVKVIARRFAGLMSRGVFLPNTPTLMNAGRPGGMLCACFVLEIEDSIEGIFETIKRTALVQKVGGGTGFSLDSLRPAGDRISTTGGVTSGPISFWRVLAEASASIQQGASRRGANMAMMSIEHPDILSFIAAKRDPQRFFNFNISTKIPDRFMENLRSSPGSPHIVSNPRTGQRYFLPRALEPGRYGLHDLITDSKSHAGCHSVRDIWNLIVAAAHATGEPGISFIDRVNRDNPTPSLGPIRALNPCGEQPLLDEEACCLGSINLTKFIRSGRRGINWPAFGTAVRWAVRFLDDILDANHFPSSRIKEATLGNRKIGLGIMGFADALVLMGIRYDSEEALQLARDLGVYMRETAHKASEKLARERGSFPNWPGSLWDSVHHRAMRNATCTTIAPTGSISILAGCSGGIEPIYKLAYRRRALDGQEFVQVHPLLETIGTREGWMPGSVRGALLEGLPAMKITGIPRKLAESLVTAHDIAPEWHVRMQAAFQENIDNAVSKTVNLPAGATPEDVDKIFRLSYELGCKGITVYRDGAREGQTFSATHEAQKSGKERPELCSSRLPRFRNRVLAGKTFKYRMGCGTLFVTVNRDALGLCEVFANLGKSGGCPSQSEATCRAVSVALRSGVDARELIEQLRGIRCFSTVKARKEDGAVNVLSCPDAIARALEEVLGDQPRIVTDQRSSECPDCGLPLRRESGCQVCSCGFSRCS